MKLKSKFSAFFLAASLVFGGSLLACNAGGGGGTPKPDFYVTVPSNAEYTIEGVTNGQAFKEGKQVSFTVTLTHEDDYALDSVYYNTTLCEKSGNTYSFLMPNENVEIRVNIHEIEKYTLVVTPDPIVRGRTSTGVLNFGGGAYPGDYTIVKESGGDGDVSIVEQAITGVTSGTVYLNAEVEGVKVLSTPISVTVRDPEKGESADNPYSATDAYIAIQDFGGDKQVPGMYIEGIVDEITENDTESWDNVSFKIKCQNKTGTEKSLLFSRIGCPKGDEKRTLLDIGSKVLVCSTLYRSGTTYRVQDGTLESVENTTPVALKSALAGILVKPGETSNPGAWIAPKGSSSETITYSIEDTTVASVDADGTVHGLVEGATELTISATGFDSLKLPVTVMNMAHAGTEDDPFTVDDAVAVCTAIGAGGITPNEYYVKGVVKSVEEHHDGSHLNSTFTLIGTEKDFIGFQVGTTVDQDNALVKGAEVVIFGALKNYNGTAETVDKDGAVMKSIDVASVHLIEVTDKNFEVSLADGDYSLEGFARTYPSNINQAVVYSSGDEGVFTIVSNAIHPVAEGTATLTVSAGTAVVEVEVTVVSGAAVDKWDGSKLVLPSTVAKVYTLDEVVFAEVPETRPTESTTLYGTTEYYVICKVASITDETYGNGTVTNRDGSVTVEVRGMMSFDGKYNYNLLTNKPVVDSVVVLHCLGNTYYQPPKGTLPEKITHQLGGWQSGARNTKVMQFDGVVCTTPEIVGIKLDSAEASTKVGLTLDAFVVSSTRGDAPLDSSVAITWAVTSGSGFASVNETTGKITGVAVGDAVVTATYGTTGLTASATVHVVSADTKITKTVTISQTDGWFTPVTTTGNIDQTVKGVRFQISSSQVSSDMVKIYKNQTMKIGGNGITVTRIVMTCTAKGTAQYGPGCFEALTGYSYNDDVGTWVGESSGEISFKASSNQVRVKKFVITYEF